MLVVDGEKRLGGGRLLWVVLGKHFFDREPDRAGHGPLNDRVPPAAAHDLGDMAARASRAPGDFLLTAKPETFLALNPRQWHHPARWST